VFITFGWPIIKNFWQKWRQKDDEVHA